MKYLAIDIETLGLNPKSDSILEIAGVFDDLNNQKPIGELNKFSYYVRNEQLVGSEFALNMHIKSGLWGKYTSGPKFSLNSIITEIKLRAQEYFSFTIGIVSNVRCNLAGKNIGAFDCQFLKRDEDFDRFLDINCSHRFLDPTILFSDLKNDASLPNLKECRKRAGLPEKETAHIALDDCFDIVELMRAGINKK